MNEKQGKQKVIALKDCMWCDFFNNSKCDLGVEIKIIKEEKMFAKAKTTHKTYGPASSEDCTGKRKEYSKSLKKK